MFLKKVAYGGLRQACFHHQHEILTQALVDEVSRNVSDIAGGLEFKIQEGAYFLAMYSLLKTEYPNASEYNFDQSLWSTKISVSF